MAVDRIDYATLSLRDALDLAILIEEEAKERYEELAAQMEIHHTPEAAAFFRVMIDNESKHGDQLAHTRAALFGDEPRRVTRAMLWDVEAPEYDEVRASMTRRDALEVALRAEQKAHAFFVAALPTVGDAETKRLFEELRDEETAHQRLVEAELAQLPPDPPLRPEDFEDEPAAQ
ncbi:MAG TPA: ferritin family protein [Candidatus Binatia bacterium]|nr:ferritin family protein [Candidatus Binatia bacterium]